MRRVVKIKPLANRIPLRKSALTLGQCMPDRIIEANVMHLHCWASDLCADF